MTDQTDYKKYAQKKLADLTPVFAKAAVGNFNESLTIPDENDEFTTLYVGIEIMLEVIREKIARYEEVNQKLERRIEEQLAIVTSIGDGLVVTDDLGNIIFFNPQAETLLGWKSEEVLHKPITDVITILDEKGNKLPEEKRPIQTVLKTGKRITAHYYCVRKDSSQFAASFTVSPVILGTKVMGIVEVFKDYSQENQIDRMKSEFISHAAHQLRTPLSSMRWDMELLLHTQSLQVPPAAQVKLTHIYESTQRMIQLVNELLNVSKISEGVLPEKTQTVDVNQYIQTAVEVVQPLAQKKQVSIRVNQPAQKLPQLTLDQQRFREVLENVLTNALKFNTVSGTVTITQEYKDDKITITVADTGMGIPLADQTKLFSKFFRATNAAQAQIEGTGLGLFMVKSYVEAWDGRVWLESPTQANGTGTTVFIQLPTKRTNPPKRKETQMKKILIIEDDGALQRIYKEALSAAGYEIYAEVTAQAGLQTAKTINPQLIILDIMLPGGLNGFDILEQLKKDEKLKNVPIIVLTNLDTEKDTALKIGAADYIVKANTSIEEVVNKVKKYVPN